MDLGCQLQGEFKYHDFTRNSQVKPAQEFPESMVCIVHRSRFQKFLGEKRILQMALKEKLRGTDLPETNIAREKQWLEDEFAFEMAYFQKLC